MFQLLMFPFKLVWKLGMVVLFPIRILFRTSESD